MKSVVDIPVIAVGRINDPFDAADILNLGHADMVAMTRQQIADPETVNKSPRPHPRDPTVHRMQPGVHRSAVRRDALLLRAQPCRRLREELGAGTLELATIRRRVVVIGAGPAGMKAAEIAARQGHDVTLIERRERTGGQLRIADKIKGRNEIGGVIDHLDVMLTKYGVDLRLGWAPTAEEVVALKPEHVIVATGSAPGPDIVGNLAKGTASRPGWTRTTCSRSGRTRRGQVRRLARGDRRRRRRRVEGHRPGRLEMQEAGHHVDMVTPLPYVGAKLGPFSANLAVPRVHASGMTTRPFTTVVAGQPIHRRDPRGRAPRHHRRRRHAAPAGWHRPVDDLYFALKGHGFPVERVGDAIASRTMMRSSTKASGQPENRCHGLPRPVHAVVSARNGISACRKSLQDGSQRVEAQDPGVLVSPSATAHRAGVCAAVATSALASEHVVRRREMTLALVKAQSAGGVCPQPRRDGQRSAASTVS